jgi:hypothetical protein
METKHKIAFITIPIPYRGAGNIIFQKEVSFHLYKEGEQYTAVPALTPDELRIANLPPELHFQYKNEKVISSRGNKDGNLHVLKDIMKQLTATETSR